MKMGFKILGCIGEYIKLNDSSIYREWLQNTINTKVMNISSRFKGVQENVFILMRVLIVSNTNLLSFLDSIPALL